MDIVTLVEIDIPQCSLTYGAAPCTAELGVTGEIKCFNTRRTCQDTENFDPAPLTLRFVRPSTDHLYDAIPNLDGVSVTPQVIDPGGSMGERESVSITFADHPHSDVGLDKYVDERAYDPFRRGTFWGKLRARVTSFKGFALRVYRGNNGDPLEDMDVAHYLIETTAGPDGRSFRITAKDVLKVADGDRAQAPEVSRGQLAAPISDVDASLTLEPAGIGDAEYPSSGKATIGGSEVVSFTRSGDIVSLTERGSSNTEPEDHDAGEAFQLALVYDSETAANIIYDLLTTYTAVDPSWIPLTDWQAEVDEYIGRLYNAEIVEPTPVRDLVNELIAQVGLVFWTDVAALQIRLTALRPVLTTAETITEDRIVERTFRSKEQPKKRVSQAWTRFGLISPVESLDDPKNFRSTAVEVDLESETENNDEPAIKKVYSRWINVGNRAAAESLNSLLIDRYRVAPRRFNFSLYRGDSIPQVGEGVFLEHRSIQDDTGAASSVPVQVVSVDPSEDRFNLEAEEMVFGGTSGTKAVFIDVDGFGVNLRELYDEIYSAPSSYDVITFIVETAVVLGVTTFVGDWPEGPALRLINNGVIVGNGGVGGSGLGDPGSQTASGGDGGTGLHTRYPITIENNGIIGGGGGGGGGDGASSPVGGGGGGAGRFGGQGGQGAPGFRGDTGELETGGAGAQAAGNGGDLGEDGENGSALRLGGAAGAAIDGDSFVTFTTEGDIRGPRVN